MVIFSCVGLRWEYRLNIHEDWSLVFLLIWCSILSHPLGCGSPAKCVSRFDANMVPMFEPNHTKLVGAENYSPPKLGCYGCSKNCSKLSYSPAICEHRVIDSTGTSAGRAEEYIGLAWFGTQGCPRAIKGRLQGNARLVASLGWTRQPEIIVGHCWTMLKYVEMVDSKLRHARVDG